MSEEPKNINEGIMLGKMLSLMAIAVNTSLEKFSSWMLAGFGAAFALILTNIESVSKFVDIGCLKTGITLYLVALAAGVIQRWLGASINSGTMFSNEQEQLGADAPEGINFENILSEVENVSFYPQKWLIRWQFNKLRAGDFAVAGKMLAKMAQIQGFLVLLQGALVISSIVVVLNGLGA